MIENKWSLLSFGRNKDKIEVNKDKVGKEREETSPSNFKLTLNFLTDWYSFRILHIKIFNVGSNNSKIAFIIDYNTKST